MSFFFCILKVKILLGVFGGSPIDCNQMFIDFMSRVSGLMKALFTFMPICHLDLLPSCTSCGWYHNN